MKIEASSLTNCSVVNGGERIALCLVDENGEPVEIEVSASDACAMAMTLPRLVRDSLVEKYRDDTLRYVFPLDDWQVETASDGRQLILTFTTGHGFEVSFVTPPDTCRSLGSALHQSSEQPRVAVTAN